jgi:tetratricopeptide (TPR) repeat protein
MPQYLSDVFTYPAARAILAGDFAEAQRLADRTVESAEPIYTETTLTLFGAQVILLHWLRGQLDGLATVVHDFAERFPWIPSFRASEAFVLAETGALDEAREVLDPLIRDNFAVLPRDGIWPVGMWALSGAVVRLEDRATAQQLYELLEPVADCTMALGASMYLGPAAAPMGALATLLERYDIAAAHFEQALDHTRRVGARPFEAHAEYAYARLLRRRGGPGDSERAVTLEARARATATELGMAGLLTDLALIR